MTQNSTPGHAREKIQMCAHRERKERERENQLMYECHRKVCLSRTTVQLEFDDWVLI